MAIHIKKSHEGLFTKAAKRAGKGVQEYAAEERHSSNKKLKKRAVFAANAAKWNKK